MKKPMAPPDQRALITEFAGRDDEHGRGEDSL